MRPKRSKLKRKMYPCKTCVGTGTDKDGETCPACNGTGKVRSKPRDHIDELYDSFKKKDMTRARFRQEYKRLTGIKQNYRDLRSIMASREIARQAREQINEHRKGPRD